MAELTLEMKFLTDVGRKRRHNEDFVDFCEPADPEELTRSGRLYIVADGVGGGADGEVASEYAVNKVLHEYYHSTEPDLGERLRAAIGTANADIFEHVEQRPELGRMGTTIVTAAVRGDELIVANVGDSRAYLIRNGEIHQITRDHSLVAKLVEEGSITPEEAEHHRKRNVVLRSIGADPDVYPDIFEGRLQPGDQIVLCSDGLTRYVSDDELLGVATRTRAGHAVRQLVDMANVRGGKDNISVMLLRATEAVPPSAVAETVAGRRMPIQPEFDTIHDTVYKRRTVSPHLPRPKRAWLPLAGVITVVLVLGALLVTTWMTGGLSGNGSADAETTALASLLTTTRTEAATAMATATSQATLTSAPTPSIRPTDAPVPSQSPVTIATMNYKVPPGWALGWVVETWGVDMTCITETNGIENPNKIDAGQVLTIPGHCLDDDGPIGQVFFTSGSRAELDAFTLNVRTGNIFSIGSESAIPCGTKPEDDAQSVEYGNWIASIVTQDGTTDSRFGDLWIRSEDGLPDHQFTFEYCAADPVWSPDGRYIAFTSACKVTEQESGNPSWEYLGAAGGIWVVPAPETVSNPEEAGHIVLVEWPGLESIRCWLSE